MANNFIANKSPQKTLSGRLNNIIKFSTKLRWLVGFFYFSGWKEVYQNLKNNPDIKIKLLVGLQVGNHLQNIFEHDVQELDLSSDEYFNDFMTSMGFAVNNEQQDTKDENWTSGTDHTTEEFKNKSGQVILKRTYNAGTYDTYYVYDDYGNLTYVLPPKNGSLNSQYKHYKTTN